MTITILGKRWNLQFCARLPKDETGKELDGDCDPPTAKHRKIRVHKSLAGKELLETLIHECTHAADTHKTEEWVSDFSRDLTAVLWKLGYHREE